MINKTIVSIKQESANSGPRAKCGPQRQNLRPAKYFLAKIILFKNSINEMYMVIT